MLSVTISHFSNFLDRANVLNNSFQLLWREATDKQKLELNPYMEGFQKDLERWKKSLFPDLLQYTEYGKIERWEKTYEQLRQKYGKQAPAISPGTVLVPEEVQIKAPTKEETKRLTEEQIKTYWNKLKTPLLITLGLSTIVITGYIYYRNK